MDMKFSDIRDEFRQVNRKLQELKSACYDISVYEHKESEDETVPFRFVSFFDMETEEMGTSIVDHTGTALKDLTEIPRPVFLAFSRYTEQVVAWQEGELPRPPFVCTPEELAAVGAGRSVFEELQQDAAAMQDTETVDKSHLVIEKREV